MPSLKDLKKKTHHGLQLNLLIYIYIYIYIRGGDGTSATCAQHDQ